jgi:hypothetical protein
VKILGTPIKGDQIFEVPADTKRVARYLSPVTARVVKLTLYCDGLGSGVGDQVLRGVIYEVTGALVAEGDEVVIHDGQQPAWVDLPLTAYPGGVEIVPLRYDLGYLAGQVSLSARVYGRFAYGI